MSAYYTSELLFIMKSEDFDLYRLTYGQETYCKFRLAVKDFLEIWMKAGRSEEFYILKAKTTREGTLE